MAREAAVLQRQSDDVGRFVRGLRPMDGAEGIPSTPGNNRASSRGASRCRFSVSIQYFWAVRHAMAEFHKRRDKQWQPVWEQRLLDGESARDVHGALSVSGFRQSGGERFDSVSEMGEASDRGCVL